MPLLRRDRDRRRVRRDPLRVPAGDPETARVLAREAADADAQHRMVERDPEALADEVRAAGGDPVDARARLPDDLVCGSAAPRAARRT